MLTRLSLALSLVPDAFDDDVDLRLVVEDKVEKPLMSTTQRKLRILALHGFGQSGDYLRIAMKTGRLTELLTESIDSELLSEYDGVEWLCPDAPLRLVPDARYDDGSLDDVDIFAWWRVLDFQIQHEHLYRSLEYLVRYLKRNGPVDGIVGFSQGAAVAMMLTALCEDTPERRAALATQGAPCFIPPPQAPFKFAIACCGFENALQYYGGFYSPRITTPSLHVVAEFDTMVSAEQSTSLAASCEDAKVINFRGTHHVPTDRATLEEMASFISNACRTSRPQFSSYALPGYRLDKENLMTVDEIDSDGLESPLSPRSSISSFSKARKTHLRITRRTTLVRRVSHGRY